MDQHISGTPIIELVKILKLRSGLKTSHPLRNGVLSHRIRPLQFNYLSHKLFLEILSDCRLWCLMEESGLEIFYQTQKKSASFKNIHCKGDSINYRNFFYSKVAHFLPPELK